MTTPQTDIGLGVRVEDRISGFEGIVTDIAEHVSGCSRICVQPHPEAESQRGEGEWFYEAQLSVVDQETEFVSIAEDAVISTTFDLGAKMVDDITGFEGIATTITFSLFNCPQVALTPIDETVTNEKGDREWFDAPRLNVVEANAVSAEYEALQTDAVEATTGSAGRDLVPKEER